MNFKKLISELKRRNVFKVATAYIIAGWLIIQIVSSVFPIFKFPAWTSQFVVILVLIGFPISIILAWAFEMTPEGVKRTDEVPVEKSITQKTGRKLNVVLGVVLVLAVGIILYQQFFRTQPAVSGAVSKGNMIADSASAPAKSIAVLPFENLSTDKANQYFADGMQDLILTKLADIGELKVIARTSTAKYASHPQDLKTIGRDLGVATILEGSVQKAGDQVLVNVQLIRAADRSHLWAQSYTRTLKNVFGVEGEVAGKIASALKAKLSPAETSLLASDLSHDSDANDLFLKAEYQFHQAEVNFSTAKMKAAIPLYRQAIARAPDFALAYARLSDAESLLAWEGGGGMDVKAQIAAARRDAEQALKLTPNLAAAQLALGYSDMYGRGDYAGALKAFDAALALKPNDADALAAKGYVERRQGHYEAAIASLRKASTLDPRNSVLPFHLGLTWMMLNRYPEARRVIPARAGARPEQPHRKGISLPRHPVRRRQPPAGIGRGLG